MLIILGLAAVLLLLLVPLLRVVFSLARGLLAREGGKAREQYYRVEGAREQDSLTDRLAVEYFEGGGFSVQGVVVAPGCHVILSLMAALFLSGGLLLSLLSPGRRTRGRKGGAGQRLAAAGRRGADGGGAHGGLGASGATRKAAHGGPCVGPHTVKSHGDTMVAVAKGAC